MSEFEVPPKNKGYPSRPETQQLFWKNMVRQSRRNPHLPIKEGVRISRERTADQMIAIRAKERAGKDWLTGILNQRGLSEAMNAKITEAKRLGSRRKITYVTIDVDDLKEKNDTNGHEEGDKLLKRVANVIRSSGRETDSFGRTGGDEFAAFLYDSDEEQALIYCRRIKDVLEEKGEHVSMGVALMDYSSPEMIEASIRGSDLAMLLAKANYKEGGSDEPMRAGDVPSQYIMKPQELEQRARARQTNKNLKRAG